jgi:hypothetical protein
VVLGAPSLTHSSLLGGASEGRSEAPSRRLYRNPSTNLVFPVQSIPRPISHTPFPSYIYTIEPEFCLNRDGPIQRNFMLEVERITHFLDREGWLVCGLEPSCDSRLTGISTLISLQRFAHSDNVWTCFGWAHASRQNCQSVLELRELPPPFPQQTLLAQYVQLPGILQLTKLLKIRALRI